MDPLAESAEFQPWTPAPDRPHPLHLLADHNPCFLLSAVLMFLGCYLLNAAMDIRPEEVRRALLLLLTINAYEFALIALGLALLRKPDARGRDGVLLLVVQMLFLADGAFLIGQLMQAVGPWGWPLAALLFALGLAKAALVMIGAKIPIRLKTFAFLALQLLLIYALPVLLWQIADHGELAPGPMYAVWWLVGLLPALYEILGRFTPPTAAAETPRLRVVRRAFVIAPWLLLVAHAAFYHYVYHADFVAADLAPLLLGLAVATLRIKPSRFVPASQWRILRLSMPAIALLLTIAGPPPAMHLPLAAGSPILLTAAAMLVVYAYFRSWQAACLALLAELLAAIGWYLRETTAAIFDSAAGTAHSIAGFLATFFPTSATAWGILAIIAAFALLAAGGLWTLRKTPEPDAP